MYVLFSIIVFTVVLGALIDIISRPDTQVKHLPKLFWVFLVILLPLIGSIAWFAVGREYEAPVSRGTFGDPRRWETAPAVRPRTTEDELAQLDREIEFHEKQAEIQRLEARLEARRKPAE
jgi:hypothetical protein